LDLSDFLSYKGAAVNHMVAVARRIAVARKAAGITQRHLATELQITREYLARLETARQPMSLRLLVQLAAALRVAPVDLIRRNKEVEMERRLRPRTDREE